MPRADLGLVVLVPISFSSFNAIFIHLLCLFLPLTWWSISVAQSDDRGL